LWFPPWPFNAFLAVQRRNRELRRGWSLRELQELGRLEQDRGQPTLRRDLLKRPELPLVLIAIAMLAYVVIVWEWL
jgi:hypothetical protein